MDYKRKLPRRQPRRLMGYNYAKAGTYFVTLNCKLRLPFFGEIKDSKMILNEFGVIVQKEWVRSREIRPNISLGPFVVMADHLHGIIIIEKEIKIERLSIKVPDNDVVSDLLISAPTKTESRIDNIEPNLIGGNQVGGVLKPPRLDYFGRLQNARDKQNENSVHWKPVHENVVLRNPAFRSPSQTLGAILRGFMGAVTSQINQIRNTPGEKIWQRGYHDHIIRNKWSYHRICIYIRNNPKKWKPN